MRLFFSALTVPAILIRSLTRLTRLSAWTEPPCTLKCILAISPCVRLNLPYLLTPTFPVAAELLILPAYRLCTFPFWTYPPPSNLMISEAFNAAGEAISPAATMPSRSERIYGLPRDSVLTSLLLLPRVFVISETTTSRW